MSSHVLLIHRNLYFNKNNMNLFLNCPSSNSMARSVEQLITSEMALSSDPICTPSEFYWGRLTITAELLELTVLISWLNAQNICKKHNEYILIS